MGCVHGKNYSKSYFCCCCFCCQIPSSTSSSSSTQTFPPQNHLITSSPLQIASIPSHSLSLHFSSLTQRGFYPDLPDRDNQDAICIRTNLQANPDLHLFAVFDGHGQFGSQCANFVRDKLIDALSADADLPNDPSAAFAAAFAAVNSLLRDSEIDDSMSGTTAIAVLVNGDSLFVANVGDSRAVMGVYEGGCLVSHDLSSDQTPFRKDEYERVRGCGARVLSVDQVEGVKDPGIQSWGDEEDDDGDPPRLWMQDAMYPGTAFTRSVGDSAAESIGVIAVPEVLRVKIMPSHLFFVVASDGIFEFLSSEAVVNMVGSFKDPRDACSALAAKSYKLWLEHESRTDDMTVIVVHIKDLCDTDNNTGASTEPKQMVMKASVFSEKARAERFLSTGTEGLRPNSENSSEMQSSREATVERCPACVVPSPDNRCP